MDVDGKYYSLWYGQFSSSASIGAGTRGETETMLYFPENGSVCGFLSFPCMIGLAFVAKEFILITIGEKWMPSVSFLQLFCLLGTILPIWLLYTQLLISYGKSNIYLLGMLAKELFNCYFFILHPLRN